MALNLDRFKADLERLDQRATLLDFAMLQEVYDASAFKKYLREIVSASEKINAADLTPKKLDEFLKKLPSFDVEYEAWYSECLAVLKQLLPDRVDNFKSLYEKPKSRKSIEYGNYVIQDYLQKLRVTYLGEVKVDRNAAIPQFRQQHAILRAAKARFESSLFEMRQLVQADLFDSEIGAARELLKNGFVRAAGAIAGVVLEKHLRQVCDDRGIKITKKHPGINDLNELLKGNSILDVPQWRHVSCSETFGICVITTKRKSQVKIRSWT